MINVSIAVLAIVLGVAVYWYAFRPLPQTSGEISAPIENTATINRDARGVPHIEAQSWQDAIFLQGYATAQDRLWQMDVLRRFGAGDLATVFGAAAVPSDERSRRMRMRSIAEMDAGCLKPDERAALVEYARGVNYFIDTHREDLPLEFALPGHQYDPRAWTIADSILVELVMYRDMTDTLASELERGAFFSVADPAKGNILFPATAGQYVVPGSNAWAVSGARAADGKPMLANDPHLAHGIPGTWHQVHLKAPGLDASGVALPGLPGVVSGHNEQIAWGLTNVSADVMDLYAEQMDERTGRYLYQGKVEQAQLDREVIGVKGAKPVEVDVWVTRHGPIVEHEHGKSFSMRWSASDGFSWPAMAINQAQNWQQFRAALEPFWGPGQNFVYADRVGHIGYQATGRMPIRRNFDGTVPLDGSSGDFEWDGYVPFEQMPSALDPASGIVASANQRTFPDNFAFRVTGSFADKYRIDQIRYLLSSKKGLTVADMLAVQKDVYSAYDLFLAKQTVAAVTKRGSNEELVREAVDVLGKWNGQMDLNEAAPAITELLSEQLGKMLVRLAAAGKPVPAISPRPQVMEGLLRARPAGWVAKDDWNGWLIENLSSVLAIGRKQQGSPVSNWRWGRLHQWSFLHPVGKELPLADRFFNIQTTGMSGSGTTVKQTTATVGPSERLVVDLGDLDKSVQNLVTGESGNVASAHYKDQWPAYYVGTSFPMQFEHVDVKEALRVKPQ